MSEQEELASYLGRSELHVIDSPEGHDGFLLEAPRISPFVERFLSGVAVEQEVRQLEARVQRLEEAMATNKARL